MPRCLPFDQLFVLTMASPVKGGGVLSLSDAITDSPCSPPHMKPARVQTTLRPRVMSRRRSMARLLATGLKAEVATPKFVLDADEHASRKRPRDALSPGDAPTAPAPARRRRSRRAASLSTQAREAMINAALIASMEQATKRVPKDMLPTTPEPVQVGKPVKPTTKAAKPSKKQRRASSGKKQRRAQRASSKKCSTRGKKVPSQRPEVPAEASKSPAVAKPPTPQPGASCGAGTDSPPAPAVPAVVRAHVHARGYCGAVSLMAVALVGLCRSGVCCTWQSRHCTPALCRIRWKAGQTR